MNTPANLGKMFVLTGLLRGNHIENALLNATTQDNKSVFVMDSGGRLVDRHHNHERGDILLGCCDEVMTLWNLARDIRNREEAAPFARAWICERGVGPECEWFEEGVTFLTDVTYGLLEKARRETQPLWGSEVYRMVASAPSDELRKLLEGTASESLLGNVERLCFVRASVASSIGGMESTGNRLPEFSVREWRNQDKASVLFVVYKDVYWPGVRAMIRTWIDIVFSESNARTDNRQLAIILDDLDSIARIEGFADSLARFLQTGGRVILGMDSLERFRKIYGEEAEAILKTAEIRNFDG